MANREMRQERMATGKNPWCQMTYIGDLGGYTMRQITYKPCKKKKQVDERNEIIKW